MDLIDTFLTELHKYFVELNGVGLIKHHAQSLGYNGYINLIKKDGAAFLAFSIKKIVVIYF